MRAALQRRSTPYHAPPPASGATSAIRSLGARGSVFAIECFLDELAEVVGEDPVAFRLAHLEDPRARDVIQAASAAAEWQAAEVGGGGTGRGIGFARYKNLGGYCAAVARVEATHVIRLVSIHGAVDCGTVIHPDGLLNQIEGGIVQAASWTLKEQVRWDAEGIHSCDWEPYPILGFAEFPPITVDIIDRHGQPSLGAGECAAGPTAAAIGNAVAHALGIRVRHMPITPDRITREINALGEPTQSRLSAGASSAIQGFNWLACDRGDEVEVLVDGEDSQPSLLSGRRDQQVGN